MKYLAYGLMLLFLFQASRCDIRNRTIPDWTSIGGAAIGLGLSFTLPPAHNLTSHWLSFMGSLTGMFAGGLTMYLLSYIYGFICKNNGFGGGDIKLSAMIGAFIGFKPILLVLLIAPAFGLIYFMVHKNNIRSIPYGVCLTMATVVMIVSLL